MNQDEFRQVTAEKKTKVYFRSITVRESINRFGKQGYVRHYQFVFTNDIEPFNKGKRIKFEETNFTCFDDIPDQEFMLLLTDDLQLDKIIEFK